MAPALVVAGTPGPHCATSRLEPSVTQLPFAPRGPEGVAVRAALARLRPRHRAAVFLRYYFDLSELAIADALGCRPGTVKSLLHRGLTVLREQLDEG